MMDDLTLTSGDFLPSDCLPPEKNEPLVCLILFALVIWNLLCPPVCSLLLYLIGRLAGGCVLPVVCLTLPRRGPLGEGNHSELQRKTMPLTDVGQLDPICQCKTTFRGSQGTWRKQIPQKGRIAVDTLTTLLWKKKRWSREEEKSDFVLVCISKRIWETLASTRVGWCENVAVWEEENERNMISFEDFSEWAEK